MTIINSNEQSQDEDVAVFGKAKEKFLSELSPDERPRFVEYYSAGAILDELKNLQNSTKDRPIWTRAMSSINKFTELLHPYFDVLAILVQSHPEWAAVAWGALRLILQVTPY